MSGLVGMQRRPELFASDDAVPKLAGQVDSGLGPFGKGVSAVFSLLSRDPRAKPAHIFQVPRRLAGFLDYGVDVKPPRGGGTTESGSNLGIADCSHPDSVLRPLRIQQGRRRIYPAMGT